MKSYSGKTILVTGHTGFKGSWLCSWVSLLGARVIGVSDKIPTSPTNFEASNITNILEDHRIDIRDSKALIKIIQDTQPDFVFHLAAQALVRPSYSDPLDTISVNALGTANLLEGLRSLNKNVTAIMITSDKAYDNQEWVWGYRETDLIGGKDPYSASKGMAELVIRSYVNSFFCGASNNVFIGIARAGNVIGGGDWAKDRIVPDCVNSAIHNKKLKLRNPMATRPWQHVLEPLSGYLTFAQQLHSNQNLHGEAFNFGPSNDQNYPVSELITEMSKHWKNIDWIDDSDASHNLHEAGLLKLNCDKANIKLDWEATLNFEETVRMTVNWYQNYYSNSDSMFDFTSSQITEYTDLAEKRKVKWVF